MSAGGGGQRKGEKWKRSSLIPWPERMKPTIQDNFLSFIDHFEVPFDSHTLNRNWEVNRYRHQVFVGSWLEL